MFIVGAYLAKNLLFLSLLKIINIVYIIRLINFTEEFFVSIESKDISTSDMVVFLEIVKQGGFAKAADALGLYLSMVSRVGKRLEDAWGGTLFYKDMRTIKLTERGKVVEKFCLDVVSRMTEAQRTIAYAENTEQGEIKVSVDGTFGQMVVMPFVVSFLKANPEIMISVITNDGDREKNGPSMGAVDISIVTEKPDYRAHLIVEKLCEYPLYLCASKEYLEKRGTPRTLDDLDHHELIRGPHHPCIDAKANAHLRKRNGDIRKVNLSVDRGRILYLSIRDGLGIGILPPFSVDKEICTLAVQGFTQPYNQKYIHYPKLLQKSKRHSLFISALQEHTSKLFL